MPIATDFGEFSTAVYETVLDPFDPLDPAASAIAGANIKLVFEPGDELPDGRIALIQFKDVMSPAVAGPRRWLVDRMAVGATNPFFGFDSSWVANRYNPGAVRGADSLKNETVTARVGSIVRKGKVVSKISAFLVDTPRETVARPAQRNMDQWTSRKGVLGKTTYFTVFAVSLTPPAGSDGWLGGVSWGYTLSWSEGTPGSVALTPLALASANRPTGHYQPAGAAPDGRWKEAGAAREWETRVRPGVAATTVQPW